MSQSISSTSDEGSGPPLHEELLEVLRRLRWTLGGLRMAGIRDFPLPLVEVRSPQDPVEPSHKPVGEKPSESVRTEGLPAHESPLPSVERSSLTLPSIRDELGDCRRCRLHAGRTHLVFGEGSETARVVFVGEGPGYLEDRQGRPFVGRAGKLLDRMIEALGFARTAVYICNAVKCRPPENRTPNADEIESCAPFLFQQLDAIRPAVICALGLTAAQALLGSGIPMNRLRGRTHYWRGIPVICTYHPAYLLRTPAQKAATWQDLLVVENLLRELAPEALGAIEEDNQ